MVQQEHALPHVKEQLAAERWSGRPAGVNGRPEPGSGSVPASAQESAQVSGQVSGPRTAAGTRTGTHSGGARLRVDARRNLESVLRAAREVFGELGYGAPMEEVARRAGVGVGTVYRRFPSKEVLVRRIAAEEVSWLTAEAWDSLHGDSGPWDALADYLSRAVATGAGRLLPPEAFRHAERIDRIPPQRTAEDLPTAVAPEPGSAEADPVRLLELLAQLVERARNAGELRSGIRVSDVVLVLTASVPPYAVLGDVDGRARTGTGGRTRGSVGGGSGVGAGGGEPDGPAVGGASSAGGAEQGTSGRLLSILLDGLRAAG